jgi:hypothetical protein
MGRFLRVIFAVTFTASVLPMTVLAQTADYNAVVAQAKADLSAGHNEQALAGGQKAIGIDPSRWEAYLVAGLALENQKLLDLAVDSYSKALERAPEPKKAGVRGLLEQCTREKLSEASSPSPSAEGPSYKDTVQWIQEHIKLAGTPPSSKQHDSSNHRTENDSSSGSSISIAFDGCSGLTITGTEKSQITITNPSGPPDNFSGANIYHYHVPFASIVGFAIYEKSDPNVGIMVKDGAASMSDEETSTDSDGVTISNNSPRTPITTKNDTQFAATFDGGVAPFVSIPYTKPVSEDAAPHMTEALKHLVDVCQNHPEQAPKSLF